MDLKLTVAEVMQLIEAQFPQVAGDFEITELAAMRICTRMKIEDRHLRPGGTVSGPAMFSLADVTVYMAVLAMIGPQVLAVTTNCAIDFMRKPVPDRDLVAECRLLKLGRRMAVADVLISSHGCDAVVARASLTYAIPPGVSQPAKETS